MKKPKKKGVLGRDPLEGLQIDEPRAETGAPAAETGALAAQADELRPEVTRRPPETDPLPPVQEEQLSALEKDMSKVLDHLEERVEQAYVRSGGETEEFSKLVRGAIRVFERSLRELGGKKRPPEAGAQVDEFGLDPVFEEKLRPFFDFLYYRYFRVDARGLEHVPSHGRALFVANHSGTLPYDAMMLKTAVQNEHPAHRELRPLVEDFVYHFPFLGTFINRIGGVRACQENAVRLLSQDRLVAVFPEGIKGIGKLFRERYRLQRFGRGGFIKLCLRTSTAIIPTAVVGAEECHPMIAKVTYLVRPLGIPYFPITPTFPWLGPLGLIPLPTKWHIRFGNPIDLSEHAADAAEDRILVNRLSEEVRGVIQEMVDDLRTQRGSVF